LGCRLFERPYPVVTLLADLFEEGLAISIITFGEVYEGIYYGTDPQQNELIFRRFLREYGCLGSTAPSPGALPLSAEN
jgi:predicted nucleic acid-binding protein